MGSEFKRLKLDACGEPVAGPEFDRAWDEYDRLVGEDGRVRADAWEAADALRDAIGELSFDFIARETAERYREYRCQWDADMRDPEYGRERR